MSKKPGGPSGAVPGGQQHRGGGGGGSGGRPAGAPLPPAVWAGGLLAAVLAAAAAAWLGGVGRGAHGPRTPPEITPLAAPLMTSLPEFGGGYRNEMLWGSYRAGLYFGMQTRSERPLMTGLMWFDPQDRSNPLSLRHEARQDDRLARYGWVQHDGRRYGRQELLDGDYAINVTMVKAPDAPGSGPGGDWAVRLEVAKRDRPGAPPPDMVARKRRVSLLWYVLDGRLAEAEMEAVPEGHGKKLGEGVLFATGSASDVGAWALRLLPAGASPERASGARAHYLALQLTEEGQIPRLRDFMRNALAQGAARLSRGGPPQHWVLPPQIQEQPSLAVAQLTFEVSEEPIAFNLVFTSAPEAEGADGRLEALTGDRLTALAEARRADFDSKFDRLFPVRAAKPAAGAGTAPTKRAVRAAAAAALSNLLGSMGYFTGSSLVKLPPGRRVPPGVTPVSGDAVAGAVVEYWRAPLFTCTPSRSFFPRGFLWDEGFHQLVVQKWDPQVSRDAIGHWLDLLNVQGWIPREQILGEEARARVPPEFIVQHPSHANPPSLVLPLLELARRAAGAGAEGGKGGEGQAGAEAERAWLARAWPRLEVWYAWFNTTQAAQLAGGYRWHGRNATTDLELNPKTLTSGLDDYPRASHPTDSERHVDLLCWMALASKAMAEIGAAAGAPAARVAKYAAAAAALGSLEHLKALHWDEATGQFLDWGLHTEAVSLEPTAVRAPDGSEQIVYKRAVGEPPRPRLVPQFGYVSLFPLLTQLLPPGSPELGRQVELLRDEGLLWTPFGLRSLAKRASLYKRRNTEHDPPYWRGQIWVNINFLALRALHYYANAPGPHAAAAGDAYRDLRAALVSNLAGQYRSTGYLWEQYDDVTGDGLSSHPFTGWTALLVLAAADAYY